MELEYEADIDTDVRPSLKVGEEEEREDDRKEEGAVDLQKRVPRRNLASNLGLKA